MKTTLLLISAVILSFSAKSQIVNIPDANFKSYLVGEATINTNADAEIQVSEANNFAGMILCENLSISDLTGIEEFTSLAMLRCGGNNITSLDLTYNTSLAGTFRCDNNSLNTLILPPTSSIDEIYCGGNNLSTIDLSVVPNITLFHGVNNNFTSLDVSNNTALVTLNFGNSPLTSIDLTGLTNLDYIACQGSGLTSLDISMCTAVTGMYGPSMVDITELNMANGNNMSFPPGNLSVTGCTSLTCVTVDNVSFANQVWTSVFDAGTTFSLDCSQGGTPLATGVSIIAVGGVAEVEVGSTLQMAADVLPANALQVVMWQVQDATGQATIDQSSGLLTGVAVGTVDVGALTIDGSNAYATMTVNVVQAAGLNEMDSNIVLVYPNPAKTFISVQSDATVESVQIYSTTGTLIKSDSNTTLSISDLNSGMYLLVVQTSEGLTKQRFIKQ